MPAKIIYYLYNVVFFTKEHIPAVYKKTKQEWVDYKELPRGAAAGGASFLKRCLSLSKTAFLLRGMLYIFPLLALRE